MDRVIELLNHAGEAACAIDRNQRLIFWNQAASDLFGLEVADVIGKPCYEVLAGKDAHDRLICHEGCEAMRQATDLRPIPVRDIRIKHKDGHQLWASVSSLRIPARWHELAVLIHLIRDITRSKSLECNLRTMLETLDEPRFDRPLAAPKVTQRSSLTTRELAVLRRIATGLPTTVVAEKLSISEATVRNHIHNILSKLGAHNRLGAVVIAFRDGLL